MDKILKQSDKQAKELLLLNEELEKFANTDPMTGLYNRRYFYTFVKKIISQCDRSNTTFSLALIDIDKFKNINDTYGHEAGDEIIKDLSSVLTESIRATDIVVRFGGEEFLVLLHNTGANSAFSVIEQIRALVSENSKNSAIAYTFSSGISEYIKSEDIKNTIKRADEALYN
ncbi:MAG: hypothetical protein C0602_10120 [Denitrovibrio sp.]|nr:MAG: hypothetical protein C0602_10120 [Denitrovibrio sp.]